MALKNLRIQTLDLRKIRKKNALCTHCFHGHKTNFSRFVRKREALSQSVFFLSMASSLLRKYVNGRNFFAYFENFLRIFMRIPQKIFSIFLRQLLITEPFLKKWKREYEKRYERMKKQKNGKLSIIIFQLRQQANGKMVSIGCAGQAIIVTS